MQPWKISIGLTTVILAVTLMLAGENFSYLKPHLGTLVTGYWQPLAWYGGLAVVRLQREWDIWGSKLRDSGNRC